MGVNWWWTARGGSQGLAELLEGDNVIWVEAIDRAGNKSVLVREVTYSSATASKSLPASVRNVLAIAGAGVVGVLVLWVISGIWQQPLSLVLRAARPTLSPGADGRLEPAVVVFELSRTATVSAEVWDASNHHVVTVFHRQRRTPGEHILVWDGRTAEGQVAGPGAYEVEVSASTMFTTVSSSTRLSIEGGKPRQAWEHVGERHGLPHRGWFER